MQAYKTSILIPEDHQVVIEVPRSFHSGPAEIILLAPEEDPAPASPPRSSHLVELAAELARDPPDFQQLSADEKKARLGRIRGSARGLSISSADFAQRKAQEAEIEERRFGRPSD